MEMEEEPINSVASEGHGLLGRNTCMSVESESTNGADFEKKLVRKVDWKLVPVGALVVLICYVDRGGWYV